MSRAAVLAATVVLALASVAAAEASEERPTLSELEGELVCKSCNTTLELSNSATAEQMRAFIRRRIAAGDTKSEIKRKLVAQLGPGVLAEPPKQGFDLLAWAVPLSGVLAAVAAVGFAARRWTAGAEGREASAAADGGAPIEPELERRVDEELEDFE
ncbi:MAG: cytochrome c-type biogenesis protein CcmH [Thermoleophilia bacterium]|nr:cytochrome c-type biogenesis protein CcmH [Thermoleophilia bacterium]